MGVQTRAGGMRMLSVLVLAVGALATACSAAPGSTPSLVSGSGAVRFQFATAGSQCDLLTDLQANGRQVPYLQAIFRHELPDKDTAVVSVTIRPYQGASTYPAVMLPGGVISAASVEPSRLSSGASLSLTLLSATGSRKDWAPASGSVVAGTAETGTLTGSIDAEMSGGAGSVHLSGAWTCNYLRDPQAHF
jgi:hypothetical protein